ncbi:MAG: hypothetical protein HGJ94_04135 [Desulfosarcina sp.]|nr:hypothetical protein [Desulfosarcina sp.]
MPNLRYIRETHLDDLRSHLLDNVQRYTEDNPWIESFFNESSWQLSSKISYDEIELVMPESPTIHHDLENTKRLYSAMKAMTLTQACDERLWAMMAHFTFWEYMRARWPAERYLKSPQKKLRDTMIERYFVLPNRSRGLIRNGISRLWWYGHVSYDEARDDPFELTAVLLKKLDVAETLLGRAFSYNEKVTKTILSILVDLEKSGKPFDKRDPFRDLMKFVNQVGGVTILDALAPNELKSILYNKISQLAAAI